MDELTTTNSAGSAPSMKTVPAQATPIPRPWLHFVLYTSALLLIPAGMVIGPECPDCSPTGNCQDRFFGTPWAELMGFLSLWAPAAILVSAGHVLRLLTMWAWPIRLAAFGLAALAASTCFVSINGIRGIDDAPGLAVTFMCMIALIICAINRVLLALIDGLGRWTRLGRLGFLRIWIGCVAALVCLRASFVLGQSCPFILDTIDKPIIFGISTDWFWLGACVLPGIMAFFWQPRTETLT